MREGVCERTYVKPVGCKTTHRKHMVAWTNTGCVGMPAARQPDEEGEGGEGGGEEEDEEVGAVASS